MKLLELYIFVSTGDHTYEDFLPCWSGFSSSYPSYTSPVTFRKANVEAMVLARENYYKMFQEKLEYLLTKLEFRYDQVILLTLMILFVVCVFCCVKNAAKTWNSLISLFILLLLSYVIVCYMLWFKYLFIYLTFMVWGCFRL